MGSLGGEAACLRPPESQPQRPPRPCCPGPDHPPSACPQGSVHLPGQGPPQYPGTRQRQVTPDHQLRPEPWALSSLTPRVLPWLPAQGVSGQPCGWSGGAFVGPGSEGSPGWSAPLSRVSPTQSGLQGARGVETPSLGQESAACKWRSGLRDGVLAGALPPVPHRWHALHWGAGGRAGSKAQVRLAHRTRPHALRSPGVTAPGRGISLRARWPGRLTRGFPEGLHAPSGCSPGTELPPPRDCPQSLQPHGSTLDQFRKKPRLSVGRAGRPRGRARSGRSGPLWTDGRTGSP